MILLYINNLQLEEGVIHIATDWEIADNLKFDSPVYSSYMDEVNRDMIVWNQVLDPTKTWYGRARALLSTGYTVWGNVDTLEVNDETDVTVSDNLPSRISVPVITTSSDINKHDTTLFTIYASGFGTVGDSAHSATTWLIEDVNSEVVYASIKDENNLTSLTISNLVLDDYTVYRFKAIFHSTSNDISPVGGLTVVTSDSSTIVLDPTINFVDATQALTLNLLSMDNVTKVTWTVYSQKDNVLTVLYENTTTGADMLTTTIPAYTMPSDTSMLLKIEVDNDDIGTKFVVFRTYEYEEEEKDMSDLIVDYKSYPETEYSSNEDATYVEDVDWTYLTRQNTQAGVQGVLTSIQSALAGSVGESNIDMFSTLTDDMKKHLYYLVRMYDSDTTRYPCLTLEMFCRFTDTYFPSSGNAISSTYTEAYVPGLMYHIANTFNMSTSMSLPSGYTSMTNEEIQSYFRETLISDLAGQGITVTDADIDYAVMWLRPFCITEELNDDKQPSDYTEEDVDAKTFYKSYFSFYNTVLNTSSLVGNLLSSTISGMYSTSSVAVFHTLRCATRYLWKLATQSPAITEEELNYINALDMANILPIVKKSYDKEDGYYEIDNEYILAQEDEANTFEKSYFLVRTYVDQTQDIVVNSRYDGISTVTSAGFDNLISYLASYCSSAIGTALGTATQLDLARAVFGVVGSDVGYPSFEENVITYSSTLTTDSTIPSVTSDDVTDSSLSVNNINNVISAICVREYNSGTTSSMDLSNLTEDDLNYLYLRVRIHDIDTINYPTDDDYFKLVYYDFTDKVWISTSAQQARYSHGYSYNMIMPNAGTTGNVTNVPAELYSNIASSTSCSEDEYRFAIEWLRPYLYEVQYNSYGQDTNYDETEFVKSDMEKFGNYLNTSTLYTTLSSSVYYSNHIPFTGLRNLMIFLNNAVNDETFINTINSTTTLNAISNLTSWDTIADFLVNCYNRTTGYPELPENAHIYNVVDSSLEKHDEEEPDRFIRIIVPDKTTMIATGISVLNDNVQSTYLSGAYSISTLQKEHLGYYGEHDYAELAVQFSFGMSQAIVEVNSTLSLNISTNAASYTISSYDETIARYISGTNMVLGVSVGITNIIAEAEDEVFTMQVVCVAQGDGISGIRVTTQPTTTTYYEGEVFDPTGMVVSLYTTSGSIIELEENSYTYEPTGELTTADNKITITYNEYTTELSITVNEPVVSYIRVTTQPDNVTYFSGDTVDLTGLVIDAVYTNGATNTIDVYSTNNRNGYTYSPSTISDTTTEITISYDGHTVTIPVTVLFNLTSYSISSDSDNTTIGLGGKMQLSLDVTPTNATIVKSAWTLSSSITGVSIDSTGLLTIDASAKYTSTALLVTNTFTAYKNGVQTQYSANKSLALKYPTTTGSFTFSSSSLSIYTGDSETLTITFPTDVLTLTSSTTISGIQSYLYIYETYSNIVTYDYLTSTINTSTNSITLTLTGVQQGTTTFTIIYSDGDNFASGAVTCSVVDWENSWLS